MNNGSSPMSTTTTGPAAPSKVAGEVLLPDDQHKLFCWKVRNGSAVQKGETIALAILKPKDDGDVASKTTTTTTAAAGEATAAAPEVKKPASSSSSSGHRRPTKRRRPGPGPGPVVASLTSAKSVAAAAGTSDVSKTGESKKSTLDITKKTVSSQPAASSTDNKMKKLLQMARSDRVPILATANGLVRMGASVMNLGKAITNPLMIGYIEECSHPTIVESLCAVCGTAVGVNKGDDSSSNNRVAGVGDDSGASLNEDKKMSRVTVSGGITVSVSASEGQRMGLQDAERLRRQRKLSLVLDLDHTLLHATNDVRARNELGRDDVRTLVLPMMEEGKHIVLNHHQYPQIRWMQHCVKLRPGIKEFLESAMSMYEIGVYTAGTRQYAEQITIILARHLVGAKCDQPDFDRLRHQIARVQRELDSSEVLLAKQTSNDNNNNGDNEDDKKPAAKPAGDISSPASSPKNGDLTDSKKSDDDNDDTLPDVKRLKVADSETQNGNKAPPMDDNSNKKSTKDGNDSNKKLSESEHTSSQSASAGLISVLKEHEDSDKKKKASPGKKRKRVTFGETPPTVKSDKPTSEELDKLRAELKEAERMEGLAHDLKQRLFGSRVVSRTDVGDLGTDVKSLKRIFPCGGTMAVVVDDREDVWANAVDNDSDVPKGEPPHNLLLVRPYHWNHFLGYADVNNASGEDLADDSDKNKSKEYDNDVDEKQLMWTGDALRRIHERYYGKENAAAALTTTAPVKSRLTVPELIRNMRREVLMGCNIVLSRLVPLHRQREGNNNRARPAFVRYAENLGAIVLPRVGPGLTHVVAAEDGTDKIKEARRTIPSCWIVKASWLMQAVWSLTRPAPLPHVLGPPPKVILSTSDDSSDDDEDLAAEFENELMGK